MGGMKWTEYSLISNFLDGCGDYYIIEMKTAYELRCTKFDCSHVNNLRLVCE